MELTKFGERLAKLRTATGISARKMSFSIGQNDSYINKIENGRIYPSMTAFFEICKCLNISERDFFDLENNHPLEVNEMLTEYKRLDSSAQTHVAGIIKVLINNK